jgi:hypothetical protein
MENNITQLPSVNCSKRIFEKRSSNKDIIRKLLYHNIEIGEKRLSSKFTEKIKIYEKQIRDCINKK